LAVIHETKTETRPKISVISFCLNSGIFLRETIESVLQQTYKNYEFIIKDGGSTDDTLEILKEYPQIRWVSEKEQGINPVHEALCQAFDMARGEYIIYLAVSDGILDPNWFKKAVEVLDVDPEVSWVWGISQAKSEDGHMRLIAQQEYLQNHPPQKQDWFPFWLATRQAQETNACFRQSVLRTIFPKYHPDEPYGVFPTIGFNYNLNVMGYIPYFLPIISSYGYIQHDNLSKKNVVLIDSVMKRYDSSVKKYRSLFLSGKVIHRFRDGSGQVIHEVGKNELWHYRKKVLLYRLKYKLRRELQKLLDHIIY
jgi:glycosyltransferase involved in cell wall biosynthesis